MIIVFLFLSGVIGYEIGLNDSYTTTYVNATQFQIERAYGHGFEDGLKDCKCETTIKE